MGLNWTLLLLACALLFGAHQTSAEYMKLGPLASKFDDALWLPKETFTENRVVLTYPNVGSNGIVYVLKGTAEADITTFTNDFYFSTGNVGEVIGKDVYVLPDVDSDGQSDLMISGHKEQSEALYIIYMKEIMGDLDVDTITADQGCKVFYSSGSGSNMNALFYHGPADVQVVGSGWALAISRPTTNAGDGVIGFLGYDSLVGRSSLDLNPNAVGTMIAGELATLYWNTVSPPQNGNAGLFGRAIAIADMTGSGILSDVCVSAPHEFTHDGRVFCYYDAIFDNQVSNSVMSVDVTFAPTSQEAMLGSVLTRIGDVNDDGADEIFMTMPIHPDNRANVIPRAFILISGAPFGGLVYVESLSANDPIIEFESTYFVPIIAASFAADLDRDGMNDIILSFDTHNEDATLNNEEVQYTVVYGSSNTANPGYALTVAGAGALESNYIYNVKSGIVSSYSLYKNPQCFFNDAEDYTYVIYGNLHSHVYGQVVTNVDFSPLRACASNPNFPYFQAGTCNGVAPVHAGHTCVACCIDAAYYFTGDSPGQYKCDGTTGMWNTPAYLEVDECLSASCSSYGTYECVDYVSSYYCSCHSGYSGQYCEQSSCDPECQNGGTCDYGVCNCDAGYGGEDCGYNMNPPSTSSYETSIPQQPLPCDNNLCHPDGGTCVELPHVTGYEVAYTCECNPNYIGQYCDFHTEATTWEEICASAESACSEYGYCLCNGNPCVQSEDVSDSYACDCLTGFSGNHCEKSVCEPNPCWEGYCTPIDTEGDKFTMPYMCTCNDGWGGPLCQFELLGCQDFQELNLDPCVNGDCVDMIMDGDVSGYWCDCDDHWTGVACTETLLTCVEQKPCMNNGVCKDCTDTSCATYYDCTCEGDFTGSICETAIDDCATVMCQNSGTCVDDHPVPNSYHCECPVGKTGTHCEEDDNSAWEPDSPCNSHPCDNGICHSGPTAAYPNQLDSDYYCECYGGWEGATAKECNVDIDDCVENKCEHGTCSDCGTQCYMCTCDEGYKGGYCEFETGGENESPCSDYPCNNSPESGDQQNVCLDDGTCQCSDDYYGTNCEYQWVSCEQLEAGVCQNGGVCMDDADARATEGSVGFACVCDGTGLQPGIGSHPTIK